MRQCMEAAQSWLCKPYEIGINACAALQRAGLLTDDPGSIGATCELRICFSQSDMATPHSSCGLQVSKGSSRTVAQQQPTVDAHNQAQLDPGVAAAVLVVAAVWVGVLRVQQQCHVSSCMRMGICSSLHIVASKLIRHVLRQRTTA